MTNREIETPATLEEAMVVIYRQQQTIVDLEAQLKCFHPDANSRPGFGLVRLLRLVTRIGRTKAVHPEAEALLASGLFDEEFYRSQLAGREDEGRARAEPLTHYIEFGGFLGLDPSSGFDSDWYLSSNPDVAAAGVNPLVHYVHHGLQEGRLPYQGAKALAGTSLPPSSGGLHRRLWTGFYHIAAPELEARVNQHFDSSAAWYLATWEYVHGSLEAALELVERSISHSTQGLTRRHLVGLAKCHTLLGDYVALGELIAEPENAGILGNSLPYVRANALCGEDSDAARLTAINELFYRYGLVGIAAKDSSRPLAMDNLGSEPTPPVLAEDRPLVSVIVPAYNAGSRLAIALDSLLAQSWRELEIIVVDDASSDSTGEIAQAYVQRDDRVRYIRNEVNSGAYPTRNNGMRQAQGDFVTVHDSDDWSHPQKLERQIQPLLHDPQKMATCSSWVRVTEDMRFVGPWMLSDQFVETNHSSCLIRRSALDVIGYWDNVNVAADTEFLWRLQRRFGHDSLMQILLNTPLSFALSDESSLTRTKVTHVKTIYYGLRRIYRESARWWHRNAGDNLAMPEREVPFPGPLGIRRGNPSDGSFEVLLYLAEQHDRRRQAVGVHVHGGGPQPRDRSASDQHQRGGDHRQDRRLDQHAEPRRRGERADGGTGERAGAPHRVHAARQRPAARPLHVEQQGVLGDVRDPVRHAHQGERGEERRHARDHPDGDHREGERHRAGDRREPGRPARVSARVGQRLPRHAGVRHDARARQRDVRGCGVPGSARARVPVGVGA
jgi:hypothetical protein